MEVVLSLFVCIVFILIIVVNIVNIYNKTKGRMSLLTVFILLSVSFISILMMFIMSIPVLWLYKKLLRAYLKVKHGSNFVGMADGEDVLYISMPKRDTIVCYLLILEISDETPPHQVYDTVKDTVSKHFVQNKNKFYKLNSALHHFGGYFYMLKEDFTVEDCVKKLRVAEKQNKLSKEELMQLISECQYQPMPKNDSVLWDCSIGVQPVEWGDSSKPGMTYYPILFRTHHFICDAFGFIQFLFGVVADKIDNPDVLPTVYLSKVKDPWWPIKLLRIAVLGLYTLIYFPSALLQDFILAERVNVLSTAKPTYLDMLATKVDNGEYLEKIKRIRNDIKGMQFSTVLFTALSLSLQEHLRKVSLSITPTVEIGIQSIRYNRNLHNFHNVDGG
ncbi:hypothetical protein FQA39_LY16946 [Lamprigera yunnana]|nr:hypothetical protein FQA39_LY16946 [Lamprigera yunnana]